MNETGCAEKACCETCGRSRAIVPAGSAAGALSGCGYPRRLTSLPVTYIAEQIYSEGLCPSEALEAGTMFPELADADK